MGRFHRISNVGAFVAFALASGCTSTSSLRRANDQIQRDHNVLIAVSTRVDELSQRTLALLEGQGALELRAASLERGAADSESLARTTAERVDQLARVRSDLVELRRQLTLLQGESEFERDTRARLEQLEVDVGSLASKSQRGAAAPPRSIDAVWRRYVDQRNHITELDATLRVAAPRP